MGNSVIPVHTYVYVRIALFLDVCLLRLDFGTFEILGTNGFNLVNEGACLDTFTVTVTMFTS